MRLFIAFIASVIALAPVNVTASSVPTVSAEDVVALVMATSMVNERCSRYKINNVLLNKFLDENSIKFDDINNQYHSLVMSQTKSLNEIYAKSPLTFCDDMFEKVSKAGLIPGVLEHQ